MKMHLVKDVARRFKVDETCIRYLLRKKKIKGFKLGRTWLIPDSYIRVLERAHEPCWFTRKFRFNHKKERK